MALRATSPGKHSATGASSWISPRRIDSASSAPAKVLEIDPISFDLIWEYSAQTAGFPSEGEDVKFYSRYESAAQRLPNGNTLITESRCGRVIEVTRDCEIVWEYVCPYNLMDGDAQFLSDVFRAYRYPYEWVPQVDPPAERAVVPPKNGEFRIAPVPD